VFTTDSRRAQPFTNDQERLRRAVSALGAGYAGAGPAGPIGTLTDSLYLIGALRTIEDVVRGLSSIDHLPKALAYIGVGVTSGVVPAPFQPGSGPGSGLALQDAQLDYAARLRAILRDAARLNIAIHAIDTAGLRAPGVIEAGGTPEFHRILAANTGGVAVVDTNDFRERVARIHQATRSLYLIGYAPSNPATGLRRIEVEVTRPGMHVQTRPYYERAAEAEPASPKPRRPVSDLAAVVGLLPVPGLPLRVAAAAFPIPSRREALVAVVLGVQHPTGGRRALERLDICAATIRSAG
jgi:VWFA-related protein